MRYRSRMKEAEERRRLSDPFDASHRSGHREAVGAGGLFIMVGLIGAAILWPGALERPLVWFALALGGMAFGALAYRLYHAGSRGSGRGRRRE